MKMKEFGPPRGRVPGAPLDPPMGMVPNVIPRYLFGTTDKKKTLQSTSVHERQLP